MILGGRSYITEAGAEFDYLKQIYQSAVTTSKLTKKLENEQQAIQRRLMMMPYNQISHKVQVSDDNISDEP